MIQFKSSKRDFLPANAVPLSAGAVAWRRCECRSQRSHIISYNGSHSAAANMLFAAAWGVVTPRGRGNELEHRRVGWGHGAARLGPWWGSRPLRCDCSFRVLLADAVNPHCASNACAEALTRA